MGNPFDKDDQVQLSETARQVVRGAFLKCFQSAQPTEQGGGMSQRHPKTSMALRFTDNELQHLAAACAFVDALVHEENNGLYRALSLAIRRFMSPTLSREECSSFEEIVMRRTPTMVFHFGAQQFVDEARNARLNEQYSDNKE